MCHSITARHIVCWRLSSRMAERVFTICVCRRIRCQRSIMPGRRGRSRTLSMNRGQPDRNGLVTVRTSKSATTSRLPTISPSRTGGPSQRTEVRERRCQTRRAKKVGDQRPTPVPVRCRTSSTNKGRIRPQQPPWPEASRSIRHARVSFPR
jgi:hypothetical protein